MTGALVRHGYGVDHDVGAERRIEARSQEGKDLIRLVS